MLGLSPCPAEMNKGLTGPTRNTFDWNVQFAPASTGDRWARRGGGAWSASVLCQLVVGATITLSSLGIVVYGTPLSTDSILLTLQKTGVDTGLTVTLAAGATLATGSGSVSVVPGDYLTLKAVQSGSESQGAFWAYMFATD